MVKSIGKDLQYNKAYRFVLRPECSCRGALRWKARLPRLYSAIIRRG